MRLPSRDGVGNAVACPLMVSALQLDRIAHGGGSRAAWPSAGRGAWQALFALSDEASPFLSLSWTGEWLGTFGESLRPAQLVFDDATGRTIGTCLLTRRAKAFGPIALRRAYLNTDGEDPSESVIVEHNAVLTAPGHERQVADALADYLDATDVDEFYDPDREVAVFSEIEELVDLCRRARADRIWRDAIADAGQRRTLAQHTFVHRARELAALWD